MHTLRKDDRDRSMNVAVSYHDVPIYRGTAFALAHIADHHAPVDVFSGIRNDAIIAEHNHQFGTHLMGQQQLVDLWKAGKGNPANSPTTTSHCGYADATIRALLTSAGSPPNEHNMIPWWAYGIDLSDHGKHEDCSHFLAVAKHLGYHFVQPYGPASSERHHVIQVASPIPVLERWNVIAKERHA